MKCRLGKTMLAIAICTMLMAQPSLGAQMTEISKTTDSPRAVQRGTEIRDVELGAGGSFRGKLVDSHGAAVKSAIVALAYGGREVARGTTDVDGEFHFSGLEGGQYVVATSTTAEHLRLWRNGTAPPAARTDLLLVAQKPIVRGQCGPGGCAAPCGPACGPACGPVCGPACGPACGPVCPVGPGPCATGPGCGPPCGPVGGPCCNPIGMALTNPIVITGLVGAAIAIPIAVNDDDDSGS